MRRKKILLLYPQSNKHLGLWNDLNSDSKVALRCCAEGQRGTSLRYMEAVCYNKKLLTNNDDVVTYPFYDPRYMKIFHTLTDIDLDWLKMDIDVEYHYNGEFSPIRLIKSL